MLTHLCHLFVSVRSFVRSFVVEMFVSTRIIDDGECIYKHICRTISFSSNDLRVFSLNTSTSNYLCCMYISVFRKPEKQRCVCVCIEEKSK